MTSYVTPKKGVAYRFFIGLIDQSNTKLLKANPTIASGDFKVSIDGGAFANLATLPVVTPAAGRAVQVDLSTSEMNGDNIFFQAVDAAGAEWCDYARNIQTTARQIDDLAYPAISGRSMVIDAAGLVDSNAVKVGPSGAGTAQTARDVGASVNVGALNGDATAAANIAKTTAAIGRGTVSGVPTTTSIPTSACTPAGAVADQFKGRILTFDANTTTTALRGQASDITASSNSATPTFTCTAFTTAPQVGDTFSIT